MMSKVIDEKHFGSVASYIRLVAIHNCSLLHVHCILFLVQHFEQYLNRSENVDELVSTVIPSAQDRELQNLVIKDSVNTLGN